MDNKINGQKFEEKQDIYTVSISVSLLSINYKKENNNFTMDGSG